MREGRINKQIIFLFFTIVMLVLAVIATIVSREIEIKREAQEEIDFQETLKRLNEIPVSAPATSVLTHPTTTINKYTNTDVPSLKLEYPSNFSIQTKQFSDLNANGFQGTYFPKCDNNHCMGIRLKNGGLDIQLIIDIIYDSFGSKCSNSVELTNLENGWIRIKSSEGYIYRNQFQLNVQTGQNVYQGDPGLDSIYFGNSTDEWSYRPETTYKICLSGLGSIGKGKAIESVDPQGGAVLLEDMVIPLSTSSTNLEIADSIMSSISF